MNADRRRYVRASGRDGQPGLIAGAVLVGLLVGAGLGYFASQGFNSDLSGQLEQAHATNTEINKQVIELQGTAKRVAAAEKAAATTRIELEGIKKKFAITASGGNAETSRLAQDLAKAQQAESKLRAELESMQSKLATTERALERATAATKKTAPVAPVASADSTAGNVFQDTLKDGSKGPPMVLIPAGSFQMGSPTSEQGRDTDEGPRHPVSIRALAIGQAEVTFGAYDRFTRATDGKRAADHRWGRSTRPVINVSWKEATAYADWLSQQTGKRYRLPTEAEWEYVARARTTTPYWWGKKIGRNRANCDGCGSPWDKARTAPIASFPANAFGLYDTAGNVWEWVQDCVHETYTGAPTDGGAWERADSGDCGRRMIRGGSWNIRALWLRSARRGWLTPVTRDDLVGFRLARDL